MALQSLESNPHEMKMSMKGAKATITINKVRFGLKDDYFNLDLSKYPKAKVIRE